MISKSINNQRRWLLVIFILSGFAGLIYQSIWSHYLGLFLGHAAYAQGLVLAIFMGGMAAGAAWIAHSGQRWRNLIRGYAIIEAAIGVLGLLFHWIFTGIASFSYDWLIPSIGAPWAVNLARWLVAATLIFPQTILLGMTFPLMSGGLIRRFPGREGSLLGGLYFTNSIGAAIGALTAVFVLLPWVGLPGAMISAGIVNFIVAALAWWLSREPEPNTPTSILASPPEQRLQYNPLLRIVLFGTALSGAASFVYEIVWIRMLSMAVGSTMHSFELMLASFIAGIALGGLWVRRFADATDAPLRLVGWMQISMGVAALASLAVYANAFGWVGWMIDSLAKTDGGYVLFNGGTAVISILIMLPAAFFAGTTLPLFTVALLRAGQGERAIGRVYAWNTLGSIIGVFAALHLFIPTFGLKLTLCIAALIDLALGLFLLRIYATNRALTLRFYFAAFISVFMLIIAVRIPFDPMKLASGVFRHGRSEISSSDSMLFYRDGKTASISVVGSPSGSAHIATNGKPDAAIMLKDGSAPTEDEPTMALAAALPLAMLESPAKVGVIGFGSGLTTHTLLGNKQVSQVDTIEIEEAMVQGAQNFGQRVARAYVDPRSKIIIDDAKSYFSGQKNKYDIIISEPSNPWISGVGALFSKEFYSFIPRHLNENGLFVQWVQLYEIDEALIGSILNSLTPAFSDYSAWLTNSSDLLIVASPKGKVPNTNFGEMLSSEPLKSELLRLGFTNPEHFNFRKVANARLLRGMGRLYNSAGVNSDYHPILSLSAPKARFQNKSADAILTLPFQAPPLLEALGIRNPLPASVEPTKNQHFVGEVYTWRARALAKELHGQDGVSLAPDLLSRKSVIPAVLLKASVPVCNEIWSTTQSQRLSALIREMADLTMSFLPPELMKGVWINPVWHKCKYLPSDFERVFSLLESVAKRDYIGMREKGVQWLEDPSLSLYLKQDFDDVAFSAILLSLIHEGQWDEIRLMEMNFGGKLKSSGDYQRQRDLIRSMTAE